MADPTNMGVIDELAFRTGRNVKLSIAGDREIARAIRRLYLGDKRGVEAIALDERDDGPVEMVGPLDPGYTQGLDDYFHRKAGAGRPPAPAGGAGVQPVPRPSPAGPPRAPRAPAPRLASPPPSAASGWRTIRRRPSAPRCREAPRS